MLDRSDGFVGLRGGIGTLSEDHAGAELVQAQEMDGKPLVLMGDNGGRWSRHS